MMRSILAAALVLTLTACGSSEPEPDVLARIGDAVITTAEFEQELALRAGMRPGYYERSENREELLQWLIDRQVQINAAERAGIPEERDFRELYERMLIQRLREKRLDAALAELSITDADILRYYEDNGDQFSRPERRQVALVRMTKPARLDDEAEQALVARVAEAREAAAALADDVRHFGAVAVEYSDDRGTRYQGGVVGWLVDTDPSRYRLPPEVIDTAFALETVGEISEPLETEQAWWLLRLVERDPARQQPLDQVRDGIHHRLTRAAAADLESSLIDELRAEESVVVNKQLLDTIPLPPVIPPEREAEPRDRRPPPLPGGAGTDSDSEPAEN
jgi:parvulin-like peptidyl-prolyl isomerase